MTILKKKEIVNSLVLAICQAETRCLKLNSVSKILRDLDIPEEYFSSGIKSFLSDEFKDFYVSDEYGEESVYYIGSSHPEARTAAAIGAILTDILRKEGTVLFAKIHPILKDTYGIEYRDFSNGIGLETWLITNFPSFIKDDKNLRLRNENDECIFEKEIQQMNSVVFTPSWNEKLKKIYSYGNYSIKDKNHLIGTIALNMCKSCLGISAGFVDSTNSESPRFAFDTGIRSNENKTVYGIVEAYQTDSGTEHLWQLYGFGCLGDFADDELNEWLKKHAFSENAFYKSARYVEAQKLIDSIEQTSGTLISKINTWTEQVGNGEIPDEFISNYISDFENKFTMLKSAVKELPLADPDAVLSMSSIKQIVSGNSAASLLNKAVEKFYCLTDKTETLFKEHFLIENTCTPQIDKKAIQEIFEGSFSKSDIDNFIGILNCYNSLLTVMSASGLGNNEKISIAVQNVPEHFKEIPSHAVFALFRQLTENYSYLNDASEIINLLEQYNTLADIDEKQSKPETKATISTDELLREIICEPEKVKNNWISYVRNALPDNEVFESAVGAKLQGADSGVHKTCGPSDNEFTLYGVGSRLYENFGNENRCAENYFILGLVCDTKRCATALLKIYREQNDVENFRKIWTGFYKEEWASEDDLAFWLINVCLDPNSNASLWDDLQNVLKSHPQLIKEERTADEIIAKTEGNPDIPDAFKSWLGTGNKIPNRFEVALAENDINLIYAILKDKSAIAELGYTDESVSAIINKLSADIPSGMNDFSIGQRIYAIQGNTNGIAEKYFWNSVSDKQAVIYLFDIYFNKGDYQSALWIAHNFSVNFAENIEKLKEYVSCLIRCNNVKLLDEISRQFPEIWYCNGVLETLASNKQNHNASEEGSPDWAGLWESMQNNPFVAPCEFEIALLDRDMDKAKNLLASPEQMSEWGYSIEKQQSMLSIIEDPFFTLGETAVDNAKKVYELQGNLHRFYENLLYFNVNKSRLVILPMIFRLLCSEKRFQEALAYYNAYPVIHNSSANIADYLWCLLYLGKPDSALKKASENPKVLFKDETLVEKIFEAAEQSSDADLVASLRRTLKVSPRNRFEESVITLNSQAMQEFISNPSKLQELGYTWTDINRFKDNFSKPYPKSNDGYSVSCRVRMFFGDSRAEQFLLDSESDSRSAKILFDIYMKAMRWDDLCALYRRHVSDDIWNPHYHKLYMNALTKTESQENCQALVDIFNSTSEFDKTDSECQWIYLKALYGSKCFSEAAMQENVVLQENTLFSHEFAIPYLNMLWDTDSVEEKEHAVRFASKLIDINSKTLSLDAMKILATINGHLTEDEERNHWIDFLSDNDLSTITHILSCCFGFIINDNAEALEHTYLTLLNSLSSLTEIHETNLNILLCFEFARNAKLSKKQYTEFVDALLVVFFGIFSKPYEEFNKAEWYLLTKYFCALSFSTKQLDGIIKSLIDLLNSENKTASELVVIHFATYIFIKSYELFGDESTMTKKLSQQLSRIRKILVSCWKHRFSDTDAGLSSDEWKNFTLFIESVALDNEQIHKLAAAWFDNPVNISGGESDVLSRSAFFLDKITSIAQADKIVDFIISLFKNNEKMVNTETFDFVVNFLSKTDLSSEQMNSIIVELAYSDIFESTEFNNLILSICDDKWPELSYFWLKRACVYHTDNQILLSNLYHKLLERAQSLNPDTICDPVDLQVLYDATCENLSVENIALLRTVYEAAGKNDQAKILSVAEESMAQNNSQCIADWFIFALEEYDIDLFEQYCKRWSRFIRLTEDDIQIGPSLTFLGLNDEPVEPGIQHSVIKMLLSDIRNTTYLKCYLRINLNLSDAAKSKLEYLVALKDKIVMDNVMQNCCKRGQYELSVRLLKEKMTMPITNSSSLGLLLGNLYTAKTTESSSLFTDILPEVYQWIDRMNKSDPKGTWKNIGRAVDIAVLTNSESLLFETFEKNIFSDFPGKSAFLIANLVIRQQYSEARKWIEKAFNFNNTQYFILLKKVISECMETSQLSAVNQILVRSIPVDGNQRSLELYGELVFDALTQGLAKECLEALEFLYEAEKNDKAFAACHIQLFSADELNDERIIKLYYALKNYFNIVQDSQINKVAKILSVVHACLPECSEKNENIGVLLKYRLSTDMIQESLDIKNYCNEYFKSVNPNRKLLIQAATGWWRINEDVFELFNEWGSLAKMLVAISPVSFSSACLSSALNNNNDPVHIIRITELLNKVPHCNRCALYIDKVQDIKAERAKELATRFAVPMEAPGVYPCIFTKLLKENTSEEIEKELTLYFSVQNNFFYVNYMNNMFKMKELVETDFPQHRISVLRVITHLSSSLSGKETYARPIDYLDAKDYLMLLNSAEKMRASVDNPTYNDINDTHILLGKIMTGQLNASEKKQIKLYQFVNMATALCQFNSYTDIDILLDLCPAKWKICVRCAQELVQGCPSNILYVLKNDVFRVHEGCTAHIKRLAVDFINNKKTDKRKMGQLLLVDENKKRGIPEGWGTITSSEIPDGLVANCFSLKVTKRNYKKISNFKNDINRYLLELRKDDEQSEIKKKTKTAGTAEASSDAGNTAEKSYENIDFRNISYVTEEVNRWYPSLPTEEAEITEKREELMKADTEKFSQDERINRLGNLIALDWNSPTKNSEVRLNCIHLGLHLFDKYCDKNGMASSATPQARSVLYDMAICRPSDFRNNGISQKIRTYFLMCMTSYDDLSQLVSDCNQDNPLELCKAINDPEVRKSFQAHIALIRQIGAMMQKSMTNQERLGELEAFIHECQQKQTTIDSSMKQSLIRLLNKPVAELRNRANVILEVYNDTGSIEEGYIYGKIQNLGKDEVNNIQLELHINEVFIQSYSLKKLEGNSFIPFELNYTCDEEDELRYTLIAKYNITDGNIEQTCIYNGTLRLLDTELSSIRAASYFVDRPVTGSNYIERPNLHEILKTYYREDLSFDNLPNLAIYGMKRTGKSSVLRWLKNFLRSERNEEVYVVNSSGEGVKGDLLERTHNILIRQILEGGISGEGLSSIFNESKGWEDFYNKWKDYPLKDTGFQWIEDFYTELSKNYLNGTGLFVCVDEVENLYYADTDPQSLPLRSPSDSLSESESESSNQTSIWEVLSRMSQCENATIRFILCGSDFFTNKALEGDNLSQFFQRIKKLSVGRMNFNEIEKAMCQIQEISDIRITNDALQYLWQICGGLPWHSKIVGNDIIDKRLIPNKRAKIYPSDIIWGVQELLNSDLHTTDSIFGLVALNDDERTVVSVLAEESITYSSQISENILYERFCESSGHQDSKGQFNRAIRNLVSERQLIKQINTKGEPHYQFGCELYRLYNRSQKVLNQFSKR